MKQKGLLSRTTNETKQKVLELYQKGHSQTYIENALHMTRKTIRNILNSQGFIIRTKSEQSDFYHMESTLRENAFDLVTDEMAYWLGFLYADGYITNPETHFNVGVLLKESDIGHLEKLKEFLKAPQKIRHDIKYKNAGFRVGSKKLHASLMRWGFTTNKSYDAAVPEVMRYNRHFWRGIVDGDGYMGNIREKPRMQLCGTKDIVEGFKSFLNLSGVQTEYKVKKHPQKSLHIFEVGYDLGVQAAKILYDDSFVYLDRKYEIYKGWLSTKHNDRLI